MIVTRLDVPEGTRLGFQAAHGPITHDDSFYDLGLVVLAEQHADAAGDESESLEDQRMVLECEGVEASHLVQQLDWPNGETMLPGTVKFGEHSYPASLQVRPRPNGLRATLRRME